MNSSENRSDGEQHSLSNSIQTNTAEYHIYHPFLQAADSACSHARHGRRMRQSFLLLVQSRRSHR